MYGMLYSFSIIFGSLFFGYGIRRSNLVTDPHGVSKFIIKSTFRFISPVILCLSFWKLELKYFSIWTLPLVGFITCMALLVLGKILASLHRLTPKETGSYIATAMFSNIGYTLGGFLCFVVCGELGLALAILYTLYYTPCFYTIGFYIGQRYSQEKRPREKKSLREMFADDIRVLPFLGLLAGVGLNIANIDRPGFFACVTKILVPAATFAYFASIGLTFSFSAVKRFKAVCASTSALKFVVSPVVGVGLAFLMGYHRILEALPMKVVVIESCMPVALSALLLTKFFDIDKDLANACWLVTTFMMLLVIPVLIKVVAFF